MTVQPRTATEVAEAILNREEICILDVRSRDAFADWKIEGPEVCSYNVPYSEMKEDPEAHIAELPKDRPILVVCAKEISSVYAAELLEPLGYDVSYLQGGMQTWSEELAPVKVYEDENVDVYQFIRIGKGCLSYMVMSGEEALVVDPARFTDVYVNFAKEHGARITHIVDSHLHADHISGGRMLANETGAQYYIMKSEGAVFDFEPLEHHDEIRFEQVKLEVLAVKTPGHTPGSVSFFVNDRLLFSGDTIFVSGLGRPDLGNKVREWAEDLFDTVQSKVAQIADDVIVLPGHYADLKTELNESRYIGNTLGAIRQQNEKMFEASKEEFLSQVERSASSVKPPNFERIVELNRGMEEATIEEWQELEIGPNRCAVHHS